MNYPNLWSGIFFFSIGMLICIESVRFGFGKWSEPGPGFLTFWSGLILLSLSLFLIIEAIRKRTPINSENPFKRIHWRKWLLTLACLLGYALLFEPMGFILCTLIFMIILVACVEPQRWTVVFTVATITTAVSYIIFQWVLKSHLPLGIIGF